MADPMIPDTEIASTAFLDNANPDATQAFIETTPVNIPSPQLATERAEKYAFATGQGRESILDQISRGDEHFVREQTARQVEDRDRASRMIEAAKQVQLGGKLDDLLAGATSAVDPDTVMEKEYGKRSADFLFQSFVYRDNGEINGSTQAKDAVSDIVTRREYATKIAKDLEDQVKQSSWGEFAANIVGPAFYPPAYGSYRFRNRMGETESFSTPGENIQQQTAWFYNAPQAEALKKFKEEVGKIAAENPVEALKYAKNFIEFTSSDSAMETFFGGVDVLTAPGVGTLFKYSKAAVRSAAGATPASHVAAAAMGKSSTASELHARAMVTNGPDALKAVEDSIPTMFDTKSLSNGKVIYSPEVASRVVENIEKGKQVVFNTLDNLIGTSRLSGEEAIAKSLEEAQAIATRQYNLSSDRVIAVRPYNSTETLGADYIGIQIGAKDGSLFASAKRADEVAVQEMGLAKGSYKVIELNPGEHVVEVLKPIDTRSLGVLEALRVDTVGNSPKVGALGWLRSPEYMLERALQTDNKATTIKISKAREQYTELLKPIKDLKKDQAKELDELMTWQGRQQDKMKLIGRSSDNFEEFARDFFQVHKKSATPEQAEAYFQTVFLHNSDLFMRNVNIKKAKESLGLQLHEVSIKGDGGAKISTSYEGKYTTVAPWKENITERDFFNLVVWDKNPDTLLHNGSHPITKYSAKTVKDSADDLIAKGWHIVQLSGEGAGKLGDDWSKFFGAQRRGVTHILVEPDNLKSKVLPFKQVEYRSGFHKTLPEDGKIIAQPRIETSKNYHRYDGDTNVHHILEGVNAEELVGRYNVMRQMKRDMDTIANKTGHEYGIARTALDSFIKANLPFNGGLKEVEQAISKGFIDLKQPFYVKDVNGRIADKHNIRPADGKDFVDEMDNHFNIYRQNVDLSYTQSRGNDLRSVADIGSKGNPVYSFAQTPHLPVGEVIDRSWRRLVQDAGLSDLKSKAVTNWVAEFGDLMKGEYSRLQRDPMKALQEFAVDEAKIKANPELYASASLQRRQILEMLGMKSDFNKSVDVMVGSVVDSIFSERGLGRFNLKPPHTWREIDSPINFFRNVAFHASMSLYNPVQGVVNLMTFTHMLGLSPTHAPAAIFGSNLSLAMRFNSKPQTLAHADKIMSKFGWGKGDFEASYKAMEKMGWNHVGGETASLADYMGPMTVKSKAGEILDGSTVFFRRTEQMIREASWHAAWSEARKANPTKVFKEKDLREILNRADTLSVNMTSASNATWQKGILSLPTQFASYQTRLFEQIWSGGSKAQLSVGERTRLVATYSAAFGIPAGGIGAATGITGAWHEQIHQTLMEKGYDVDMGIVGKLLNQGIAGATMEGITGSKWDTTRFAPSGNSMIKDLLFPEDTSDRVKAIGGVGVATAYNIIKSFEGPIKGAFQTLPDVDTKGSLNFVEQDVHDVLNAFGTGKVINKAYYAAMMGVFVDKRGGVLTETTASEGLLAALSGLVPQRVTDFHTMIKSEKARKDYVKEMSSEYSKYVSLALKETDEKAQDRYFKRAGAIMAGIPEQNRNEVFSSSMRLNSGQIERLELKFNLNNSDRLKAITKKDQQ